MRTRSEAIENLEYLISGECCDSHMDYIEEIEMAITDMKICEANNAGWISVRDSLPENIKPVLVWESQGFAYVDNYLDGAWSIGSANGAILTHWMPITEPPKEET